MAKKAMDAVFTAMGRVAAWLKVSESGILVAYEAGTTVKVWKADLSALLVVMLGTAARTRSPGLKLSTAGPASTTTPAMSWGGRRSAKPFVELIVRDSGFARHVTP